MMSFEECQEMGRKIREERAMMDAKCKEICRQQRIKQGLPPDLPQAPTPKYEHMAMPGEGIVIVLFIVGYLGSLIFKNWWIAWIILTVLLGKFITRHDND
jgi:hypothetical protein